MTLAWFDLSCHVAISPHVLFTCFSLLGFVDVFGFSIEAGVSFHGCYFVRFVANMMLRTVLRADCSRFLLFLCVCSNAATTIATSMAHAGAHALASLKPQQKCQVEQGQIYIWIFCSICCKHDAKNGASGRLLTFLAVSLCVFKCRNNHCHFHGSCRCTCTRFIETSA